MMIITIIIIMIIIIINDYNYNSNNDGNDHVNNSDHDHDLQKIQDEPDAKFNVKKSGDGTRMSRLANFVIMSYSVVDNDDVMSSKGNTSCSEWQFIVPCEVPFISFIYLILVFIREQYSCSNKESRKL